MLKVLTKTLRDSARYRWGRLPWSMRRTLRRAEPYAEGFFDDGRKADVVLSPRYEDAVAELPVGERCYEYAFTVSKLREGTPGTKDVLDVGSAGSVLPGILAAMGHRVWSVDLRRWPMAWPGLTFVQGDLFEVPLEKDRFDVVTCISTIEHVGLGRFGDAPDPDGDLRCMRRIRELVREGGRVVLTMPYGRAAVVYPRHRIYNRGRLARLTAGFDIVDQVYFAPRPGTRSWMPCAEEDTFAVDPRGGHATTCCLLRKRGG